MAEKQCRTNWSADERDVLIDLCSNSSVANGKFSSKLTAADKGKYWADVTNSINSVSTVTRTTDQVKKKWIDMKSSIKRKTVQHNVEVRKTGGGPAPVLDMCEWESKVLNAIPSCSVVGISGGSDTFLDNDTVVTLPGQTVTEEIEGASCTPVTPIKRRRYSEKSPEETPSPASIQKLIQEQTAIMKEMVDALKTLNQSLNEMNTKIDKYFH